MPHAIPSDNFKNILGAEAYVHVELGKPGLWKRFISLYRAQLKRKLIWKGIAVPVSIGIILPLTLLAIIFFGDNHVVLWVIAFFVNAPVLTLLPAALSPKVKLPAIFIMWLIDACIIVTCISIYITA